MALTEKLKPLDEKKKYNPLSSLPAEFFWKWIVLIIFWGILFGDRAILGIVSVLIPNPLATPFKLAFTIFKLKLEINRLTRCVFYM